MSSPKKKNAYTTWKGSMAIATPISLGLSWPLTNRHLLRVASHLHYCVIGDDSTRSGDISHLSTATRLRDKILTQPAWLVCRSQGLENIEYISYKGFFILVVAPVNPTEVQF